MSNMVDGVHYKFLNYPKLPDELEQLCLDQLNKPEFFIFDLSKNEIITRKVIIDGEVVVKKQCTFEVFSAPTEVIDWLLSNKIIDSIDTEVVVQRSYNGTALFPHTDNPENYNNNLTNLHKRTTALNYLLSESGPTTCFYNTNNLNDILESVLIPKSVWHTLNVNHLHGVENIEFDRISLSITLN